MSRFFEPRPAAALAALAAVAAVAVLAASAAVGSFDEQEMSYCVCVS